MNANSITVACAVTAAPPLRSPRVLEVAAMFGLGVDESREMTIVPPCAVPIPSAGIVFITGPSGSGKSTILRLLTQQLIERGDRVIDVNAMDGSLNDERPLIDRLGEDLREATSLLSLAGLGDAFVMLRREAELSDGQRFRFRLALAMEAAMSPTGLGAGSPVGSTAVNQAAPRGIPDDSSSIVRVLAKTRNNNSGPTATVRSQPSSPSSCRTVIIADEFAATLDRLTAKTIARNVRRWIDRLASGGANRDGSGSESGGHITFIAATTHDDLLEPLHPDVLIHKGLGDHVEVMTR